MVFAFCYFEIPDKIVELINLLLVVVGQGVLLPLLAFDEYRFHLRIVYCELTCHFSSPENTVA